MTPPPPSAAPTPDWSQLIEHWGEISKKFFDDLSVRAKANSTKFQDNTYDRDAWLADFSWFVKRCAKNAAATAEVCNDLYPRP